MYMPHPHYHGDWAVHRAKYNAHWKEKHKAKKKRKAEANAADPPNK